MYLRPTLKLTAALTAALLLQLPSSASAQTATPAPAAPPAATTPAATPTVTTPAAAPAASPYSGTPDAPAAGATATTGSLRGRATDPDKAVIPGLTITLTSPDGKTFTTQTTGDGTFLLPNVLPGTYTASTKLGGFADYSRTGVKIAAGSMLHLNFHLQPEVNTIVNVKADNGVQLSVNPDNNASTLVLSGKDLDALSDDPDELSDELNALAGPAAGPNGGQIYIDGFTGGTLPPKSSIREIRINQNPFSAQYDKIGYGRIEVFTKPGTDKLHGSIQVQGGDNNFNTSALSGGTYQPPYHSELFQGSLTGPLSKRASYSFGGNYRDIEDNNFIDTTVIPSVVTPGATTYAPFTYFQSVFFPQTRIDLSPRFDLQVTPTNTLTARYQFDHNSATNGGIGGGKLASAGYNSTENNNEIQLSDSQTIGTRMINELRFEYTHNATSTTAQVLAPSQNVQGAFFSNGDNTGVSSDIGTQIEVQNYSSLQLTSHFIRFGGRLRVNRDNNNSTAGTFGGFTYGTTNGVYGSVGTPGTIAYDINALGAGNICQQEIAAISPAPTATTVVPVTAICNYAITQQQGVARAPSIGPSQFNANSGNTSASASEIDLGLYAEDDWKIRPNLTLSAGLRYETQTQIGDHHDFAPRLAISWGLGSHNGAPGYVLRAGYGFFYDRFGLSQIENLIRYSGLPGAEQQITVSSTNNSTTGITTPVAFTTCDSTCIATQSSTANATLYSMAPNLRTPYMMQFGGSIEHQVIKPLTVTVTYLNTRGTHQLFSQNLASLSGASTTSKNYQYVSEGIFKQNQLLVQSNFRGPRGISLFGFYVFNHANGDTSGPSTFPSVPGNLLADYGRTSQDIRQRVFLGGSVPLPFNISLNPFLIANSGAPFNITAGSDLNGDTILNDRPAFCSASTTAQYTANTKYGCFDLNPSPTAARIPINYAQAPAQVVLNLRATKTFGFGAMKNAPTTQQGGHQGGIPPGGTPGGGGHHEHSGGGSMGFGGGTNTGHKYNLTVGAQVNNIFNIVNYNTPSGNLSSPQFGQATQLAGNIFSSAGGTAVRRITLQANFTF